VYFQHLEGQVTFADTKAGLLLTADSILLTGLGLAFERLQLRGTSSCAAFASGALLIGGICATLVAIAPNPMHFRRRLPARNHFQFSAVARHFADEDEFISSIEGRTEDELEQELLRNIFGKAKFAYRKFRWLLVAVALTLVALLFASFGAAYYILHT
jgi:hypothetical protein